MEKIFSRDTFMALHLPFRSLLAPAETIRGEIEAILYNYCVKHSRYDLQCYFCGIAKLLVAAGAI